MGTNPLELSMKKDRLNVILKQYDSVAVAFSGGVDSTYLLAMAHNLLKDKVVAVTSESPIHPRWEIQTSREFTRANGISHHFIHTQEFKDRGFLANGKNRCYVCKRILFTDLLNLANDLGISHVIHGANLDDIEDAHRPGLIAARELGIQAPLAEAGLKKMDIRILSKQIHLDVWNKPPMACLATRIPTGTRISIEKLRLVETAEEIIRNHGFVSCRVRLHDNMARIELNTWDMERFFTSKIRGSVLNQLLNLGFSHVALDLEGYVQGKMHR